MNIRLVAYRPATSSATATTAYNLDLQEAPSIALNFQFSDIKEPESRKGSYSQTFKLPFTDNNNEFFQNWYNVNLETLVFSTRKKLDAVLYVGTIPQFEGQLQLKSVYQKAQYYEVVLMSTTATLFSTIGEKMLKDVFKNDDGSYSTDFNHVYTYTNATDNTLYNSWGNSLVNTAGDSLYDSDASVSKIVYPLSVTQEGFYYDSAFDYYLKMDSTSIANITASNGIEAANELTASFMQFRPSVQLKAMLNRIFAVSGFSYTSTFLDSEYFGKLFMTTGNHLELSALPTTNTNANPSGLMEAGNSVLWGSNTITSSSCVTITELVPGDTTTPFTDCTIPNDPENMWNTTYSYFTKTDVNQVLVVVKHAPALSNVYGCDSNNQVDVKAYAQGFDVTGTITGTANTIMPDVEYGSTNDTILMTTFLASNYAGGTRTYTIDISSMPVGASAQMYIDITAKKGPDAGAFSIVNFGQSSGVPQGSIGCSNEQFSSIRIDWVGYSIDNIFGATVDFPACIDPGITQKAFLKDIIQRFNLIVLTNPNDDTNLLIEPYQDFISSGSLKHWTEKLDTSKEITVRDTTEIQKKTIHLTDQEDEDLYNKSLKERTPSVNVYGHLKIEDTNNDFATGVLQNDSLFSPFINSQVFVNDNEQFATYLPNMTIQYEHSYSEKDGVYENKIGVTKPKLFYYNGTATDVLDVNGDALSGGYNLHRSYSIGGNAGISALNFTKYPVCSPFDITPSSNEYTLTQDNKSLYWNATPPMFGDLTVFNYNGSFGNWYNNTLYGKYWKPYLDNIYSTEARIMDCYLNLNEVDIFDFQFNDEIFIKDTYWRVLTISNYQVGSKASTKVTLIKSLDKKENCNGCDYVIGSINGVNLLANTYYMWCPEDTPDCVPVISGASPLGGYTSPECCICNGGLVQYQFTDQASNGLYPCLANAGSLPVILKSIFSSESILKTGQAKTLINGILAGRNMPLIRGVNTGKYSQSLLPLYGDDMIIKYKGASNNLPNYNGESHKLILSGNTVGTTRGYAYPEGSRYKQTLRIPQNVNVAIRVTGIATVIGGTDSTYVIGVTESFAYYTGYRVATGSTKELGTAGGVEEYSITEVGIPSSCTLHITLVNGILAFGLDDTQADTKRIWTLTAHIDINSIKNIDSEYGAEWALYQNGQQIQLQNGDYLIWN